MFARIGTFLARRVDDEVTRRAQMETFRILQSIPGFAGVNIFADRQTGKTIAISLWEKKENAEAYGRDTYPAVLQSLERVVEGTPEVDSYEVSNSTFHKIASQNPSQPIAR